MKPKFGRVHNTHACLKESDGESPGVVTWEHSGEVYVFTPETFEQEMRRAYEAGLDGVTDYGSDHVSFDDWLRSEHDSATQHKEAGEPR